MNGLKDRFLRTCAVALAAAACVVGGEPAETDDAGEETTTAAPPPTGEPAARVAGKVDVVDLCGVEGATMVTLRATRVGCEQSPPAPCTLKVDPYQEYFGDATGCPASNTDLEMAVEVPQSGRYYIEARAITQGGYIGRCYGVEGGEDETLVTKAQIDARDTIYVQSRTGPCPPP